MFSAPLVPLVNGALLLVLLITHGGVGAAASRGRNIQTVVSSGLPHTMYGIACEPYSMDLYISGHSTNTIMHVDMTTWTAKTFAGSTSESGGLADGIRTDARFNKPIGMMWSEHLTAFLIADYGNHNIRKMTTDGSVTTYAGSSNGTFGFRNGLTIQALFRGPTGIAQFGRYGVAVADQVNSAIRIIDDFGKVSKLCFTHNPLAITASSSHVYTTSSFSLIRFDRSGRNLTLAGLGSTFGSTNGVGTAARFGWIRGITLLPDDDVLVTSNNTVRHIRNEGNFYVSTYIGNLGSTDVDGFGTFASLRDPRGLQYLSTGIGDFVFVCTFGHLRIIEGPTYESSASAGSVVDSTSAVSTSVIVAICVLSVVVLSALVALVVFFLKRPTQRDRASTTTPPPPETTPSPPPPAAAGSAGFQRGDAVQGTVVLPVQPQPPPAYSAGEYLYSYPSEKDVEEVYVEIQPAGSR